MVNTSALLRSLPKSSSKLVFAVSTEIIKIWGYFKSSTRKVIFRTRRFLFSHPFCFLHTERLETFCSKWKNDKNAWNKKTLFFRKNSSEYVECSFSISLSLFYHKALNLHSKFSKKKKNSSENQFSSKCFCRKDKYIFHRSAKNFSQTVFRCKYKKYNQLWVFQFSNEKNYLLDT